MLIKADEIARRLDPRTIRRERMVVAPAPNLKKLEASGEASLDLRLGTWIVELKRAHLKCVVPERKLKKLEPREQSAIGKKHFIPFGKDFILHPGMFVLGATLEWLRLPNDLGAYVIGKSSWGRVGLIIATATGVHPGFTGCLTLEITNVGELPIEISPGMRICQLFFHTIGTKTSSIGKTGFHCHRRPVVHKIEMDETARRLSQEKRTRRARS